MLTGETPFPGETITDILAAVVKTDPDLSHVPAKTKRLLQRCLEKDLGKRLRDIGDYADLLNESTPAEAPATRNPLPWTITAAASIAALSLAAWVLPAQRRYLASRDLKSTRRRGASSARRSRSRRRTEACWRTQFRGPMG